MRAAAQRARRVAPTYERPLLSALGTVAELTRQDLKIEGGTDFVAFRMAS